MRPLLAILNAEVSSGVAMYPPSKGALVVEARNLQYENLNNIIPPQKLTTVSQMLRQRGPLQPHMHAVVGKCTGRCTSEADHETAPQQTSKLLRRPTRSTAARRRSAARTSATKAARRATSRVQPEFLRSWRARTRAPRPCVHCVAATARGAIRGRECVVWIAIKNISRATRSASSCSAEMRRSTGGGGTSCRAQ